MKMLSGTPRNISRTIIGRITHKPKLFKKKDYIIVENEKIQKGYAGLISSQSNMINLNSMPIIYNVLLANTLSDGDIVSMNPNGDIIVMYDIKSVENSLLLTERCNSSCIMCPQPPVGNEEDKISMNLRLISLMNKNTCQLGLTGGEPTLLKEKLFNIIEFCKKELPKTELSLLSNGINFEDIEYTRQLVKVGHPKLFIDIPLYSDIDSIHNEIVKTKGFYHTIQGLYNLALLNQKVGVRIVIIKQNYRRLSQMAEFIYRNFPFVFHVAFMQMEPTGLGKINIEKVWIDPFDYQAELEKAVLMLNQRDLNVSIYNAQLCVLPKSVWHFARKSISTWKNVYLNCCEGCGIKEKCGGLFESSINYHSSHIRPVSAIE